MPLSDSQLVKRRAGWLVGGSWLDCEPEHDVDKSNNSFLVSATLTSLCFVTGQANREVYNNWGREDFLVFSIR